MTRRRVAAVSAALLLFGVLPAMSSEARADEVSAAGGGVIAYSNGSNVRTMSPDGSARTSVTTTGSGWDHPAWSSDGEKLAFSLDGIYTARADGSHLRHVTRGRDEDPSWSPGGRHLVFTRYRHRNGPMAIFRVDVDGKRLTRLTGWSFQRIDPAWSPDGSKIAYVNGFQIATMKPDGSGKAVVPNQPPDAFEPAWSPDGTKFAFSGGNGCWQIYTINADGSELTRLTPYTCQRPEGGRSDHDPSWSPDGSQIAFDRSGGPDRAHDAVIRMNSDGSDVTRLTPWLADAHEPAWGPRSEPLRRSQRDVATGSFS